MNVPHMESMGLANIEGTSFRAPKNDVIGSYCRMHEKSMGKDTTVGHWEMAGMVSPRPLPTYPEGFPQEILDEFIQYRIASNWWNKGYQANLDAFDRYCIQQFPEEPALLQEMLNSWYDKKPTECLASTRSRTQVVTTLVRYIQKNHNTDLFVPQLPRKYKRHYIPHSFSDQELAAFFSECDKQVLESQPGEPALRALTISVIFRTLYSTGMRTTEARLLKTDEVNFDEGIVSITSTKGDRQHYVALDSGLNAILFHYNKIAQRLLPERGC